MCSKLAVQAADGVGSTPKSHVRTRFEGRIGLHAERCAALKEGRGFHDHHSERLWVEQTTHLGRLGFAD